jgi:hypothetical protein
MLQNPTRVIKPQVNHLMISFVGCRIFKLKSFIFLKLKVISLAKNCRYQPLKEVQSGGLIMLRDTQSDEPEVIVETVKGT